MTLFIIIFGALTLLAGIIIVINPEMIFGFLRNHLDSPILHILAGAIRFALGVLLIYQANMSKFPSVIEVLGWLSIGAAIFLTFMGRRNFNRLMSWALSLSKSFGRVGGVFAVAFGAFLIYVFV
jgi:threonine/homoserine/homoserine lactone efflux protein